MKRVECSACGYDGLEQFLDLGQIPIADAYTDTPDELVNRYPLQLAVCTGCWLVQLVDVVDHSILFGTGYSFYSSASAPLSAYHYKYAREVLARHHDLVKKHFVVEVGCNDGDFSRHLHEFGCRVIGVDPAMGPAKVARERGLEVLVEPFGRDVAERIRDEHGPAGLVIANHVLAHVESVSDVLDGVQHLLTDDGVAYIEVQYLPDLLVNNAFDLAYHEHSNFFSLVSLAGAARRWGLSVDEAKFTDRQGGSLRVQLRKGLSSRVSLDERWLQDVSTYRGFQGRVDRIKTRLTEMVWDATDCGKVIGYGAPAKATTLLNFCGFNGTDLDFIIDTTEAKQGRYVPGTGIQILSPNDVFVHDVKTILLLAWNYARTIMRKHQSFTGDWIVPIPAPVLL